jgi:hypothetical protein
MNFNRKWIRLHFGRFLTNTSGHPGYRWATCNFTYQKTELNLKTEESSDAKEENLAKESEEKILASSSSDDYANKQDSLEFAVRFLGLS